MPDSINTADAAAKAGGGLNVYGNPDLWVLINKVSSKSLRFAKFTKAMEIPDGLLVQVSTEHWNPNGVVTACAEAITFVPNGTLDNLK